MNFLLSNEPPPFQEFVDLRAACGWGVLSEEIARKSLATGIANTTAFEQGHVAGFGRVIGDGAIYFYIQDLIVAPGFRSKGLGTQILNHLIEQVKFIAAPGAAIGLMSAIGKEAFYSQFGFTSRPNRKFGAGMTLLLDDN